MPNFACIHEPDGMGRVVMHVKWHVNVKYGTECNECTECEVQCHANVEYCKVCVVCGVCMACMSEVWHGMHGL